MAKGTLEKSRFSKIHHFGILVKEIDKAKEYLSSLGVGPFITPEFAPSFTKMTFGGKPVKFWNERAIAKIGDMEIELFSPRGDAIAEQEFLKTKGDGIHHIAFIVKDLDKEVKRLTKDGAEELECARWAGGGGFVYLTNPDGGVNIELVQF
jgi:methylmalonyl-CoA/ethylmalonyl-CoA epimerase